MQPANFPQSQPQIPFKNYFPPTQPQMPMRPDHNQGNMMKHNKFQRLPPQHHNNMNNNENDVLNRRSKKIGKFNDRKDYFKQSKYRHEHQYQNNAINNNNDDYDDPNLSQMNFHPNLMNINLNRNPNQQPINDVNLQYDNYPIDEFGQDKLDSNYSETKNPKDAQTFFKTKMCPHMLNGNCNKGPKCNYAHTAEELRELPNLRKTKMCQNFMAGRCNSGMNCPFAHGETELRSTPNLYKTSLCLLFLKTGNCVHMDKCRYAHGEQELRSSGQKSNISYNQNPPMNNNYYSQNYPMNAYFPENNNYNTNYQNPYNSAYDNQSYYPIGPNQNQMGGGYMQQPMPNYPMNNNYSMPMNSSMIPQMGVNMSVPNPTPHNNSSQLTITNVNEPKEQENPKKN